MMNNLTMMQGALFVSMTVALNVLGQGTTNLMPTAFTNVYIDMTTNALQQARATAEWTSANSIPSPDALESISGHTFFESVGYDFALTNTLRVITFYASDYTQYAAMMPGFVKGCIQKYGNDYEKRFIVGFGAGERSSKVALLRWDKQDAVVVAEFVTPASRDNYRSKTNGGEVLYPYMLRIFKKNIQHPQVDYYGEGLPAEQDTSGLAFDGFPGFLDTYSGPVFE
jgi:hypothetical protein